MGLIKSNRELKRLEEALRKEAERERFAENECEEEIAEDVRKITSKKKKSKSEDKKLKLSSSKSEKTSKLPEKTRRKNMSKVSWKPGNMLYPVPAVMVSCARKNERPNIITVAWAGTINTNPPMLSISVRKERYSYSIIKETGEFVVNLVNQDLVYATDYCGVRSGRDVDKYETMGLTPQESLKVKAPGIAESPVNIECKVVKSHDLGSHTMFMAEVVNVTVDDSYMDESGKFDLNASGLVAYSHGEYFLLGKKIGMFGFSVRKNSETEDSKEGKSAKSNKKGKSEKSSDYASKSESKKSGKGDSKKKSVKGSSKKSGKGKKHEK